MAARDRSRWADSHAKPHIGIIGAGLSGLRCADILLQHGFEVTIIEGRNRIGGRLTQQKLPNGHWVDIGPNWIHGTKDNPFIELARQTNTSLGEWDEKTHLFDEFGKLCPFEEGQRYANYMWDIIGDAFKYAVDPSVTIGKDESLFDFFEKKVVEKIPDSEADWERKRRIVIQISDLWGAFVGSSITRQSLKFFWLEQVIEGENLFCSGTYKKILELIAKPALEGAEIRFDTMAEKVIYNQGPNESVDVRIQGGQTLKFDEVIVTSPLGWLKRNLDTFEPPLPAKLTKSIQSIGWGCLEKVYITFPEAFWLSKDGDKDDNEVEGFAQWLSPIYASDTNPQLWNQEVVELASLTSENSHPTLLFYIYGAQSEHITNKITELSKLNKHTEFLLAYFKPYYSRLPHYNEHSPACKPTYALGTTWLHDDLAGNGSYTNFQVGLEQGDVDIETMRMGLPDQGLWFAGEHTSPFEALGTATGAYFSGEAVGERIAKAYGRKQKVRAIGGTNGSANGDAHGHTNGSTNGN